MKRIVVDSSASLYKLDGVDFAAVPLKIVTDEREYLDDGTLDAVEMATTLRTYKGKTSTSCPNIGDWLEAYEGADEIYAITITGTLSGSCNAAQLAAEEYQAEHPGAQVFVLDSLSAGPELVLLAEHIRALIEEGRDFDEVCEEMLRYRHHTHLLFSLESLANLARNGRVKPAVAAVARMLNIRVIGKASDVGELEVLCKTRGEHGALERIVLELKSHGYTNGKVKEAQPRCIALKYRADGLNHTEQLFSEVGSRRHAVGCAALGEKPKGYEIGEIWEYIFLDFLAFCDVL